MLPCSSGPPPISVEKGMAQAAATHRQPFHRQHGPEVRGSLPRPRPDASAHWQQKLAPQ